MKKVALFLLLTSVVLGHYVNSLTLLLPLSATSKVTLLILSSCVFSSAALLAILVLLATWNTTRKPDGSNRLATLARKEKEILAGKAKRQAAQTFNTTH
ncbi:hypothetical protein ebrios_19C [Escherichia phage Ebrios]|uniref:Uncharacterized protein n=1 Tax=Escherichia phage Ebrios TaxID=2099356 RepID=A0A2S2HFJ4_9CAUD|nr:hypothetical protein HOS96_gp22 [Escherichia phage Ebrios]AWL54349.1 hypothetical protein ebrios_19C [Escherichia phage Ebrios]